MVFGEVLNAVLRVPSNGVLGVASAVGFCVAILHLDNWLFSLPFFLRSPHNRKWQIPHVTPIPLYSLSSGLKSWLHQDWETGLYNVNQLLTYTLQFIPVAQAINQVLAATPPEQVIFRVVQLAETPFDWQLVRFASASLNTTLKSEFIKGIFFLPSNWIRRPQARFVTDTRLDTPAVLLRLVFGICMKKNQTKQWWLLQWCVLFFMVKRCSPSPKLSQLVTKQKQQTPLLLCKFLLSQKNRYCVQLSGKLLHL
jgi:hypothetical protein